MRDEEWYDQKVSHHLMQILKAHRCENFDIDVNMRPTMLYSQRPKYDRDILYECLTLADFEVVLRKQRVLDFFRGMS